jgi:hypothetical protein
MDRLGDKVKSSSRLRPWNETASPGWIGRKVLLMAIVEFELVTDLDDSYARHAQFLDQVNGAGGATPARAQIQDVVSLGLFVYQRLKRHGEELVSDAQSGRSRPEHSRELAKLFAAWLTASQMVLNLVRRLEQQQPEEYKNLDDFEVFKAAVRDVSLMSLDCDRVQKSITSLQTGAGISFERAMEELRNNLR